MRLIDADELQDAMLNLDEYVELCDVLKIIDNAPTVDKGYNEGHIDGMLKAEKLYARPTGKWINVEDFSKWLKEQTTGYDYNLCEVLVERDRVWRNAVEIYFKERGEKQ